MIDTTLSSHARKQAQRRGITQRTLDLVLNHCDRSHKLPGNAKAMWISRKGRNRLVRLGFSAAEVSRASGVRLIRNLRDDVIVTVEHCTGRRRWA